MWLLLWVFFIVLFLLTIFYLLNFFIGVKDWEMCKLSAFESGFLSMGKIQNSFSVHFFIMMLIFVIFDLEIVLFLGIIISDLNFFWNTFLLFLFIIGGFYLEWWMGKLIWVI